MHETHLASYPSLTSRSHILPQLVSRDTSASWIIQDHDHAPYYHRRHICMMGDAAHASFPFAGNGAAQAIEDAAVLNALFGALSSPSQIPHALAAYDAVRRPRSQKVVEIARDFGRLYGFALPEYGDDPVKMKGFFAKLAAFTNNADLGKQNDDAVKLFRENLAKETTEAVTPKVDPEAAKDVIGKTGEDPGRTEVKAAA